MLKISPFSLFVLKNNKVTTPVLEGQFLKYVIGNPRHNYMIGCLQLVSNTEKVFWEKQLAVQPTADIGLYFLSISVRSGLLANIKPVTFELSFPEICFSCAFFTVQSTQDNESVMHLIRRH